MKKDYLEKIKFDENGNFLRTEDNLYEIIDLLFESENISAHAILELQEIVKALSDVIVKISLALGVPKEKIQ